MLTALTYAPGQSPWEACLGSIRASRACVDANRTVVVLVPGLRAARRLCRARLLVPRLGSARRLRCGRLLVPGLRPSRRLRCGRLAIPGLRPSRRELSVRIAVRNAGADLSRRRQRITARGNQQRRDHGSNQHGNPNHTGDGRNAHRKLLKEGAERMHQRGTSHAHVAEGHHTRRRVPASPL